MFLHRKKVKFILKIMFITFVYFQSAAPYGILAEEKIPERVFEGGEISSAILANLDYTDVKNSVTWAKDAIWETGALELMKGYGEKRFGLGDRLTIEQALLISYNMAGREDEAQLAAEALDLERNNEDRKIQAPRMWSDGYIQLALNDGLITQQQYDDAFRQDQSSLDSTAFHRNSPVTREDMAFFIAKVLEINPINQQTHLFNDYRDWREANPHRIPYVEALLQNRVMNGNNNGSFSPKGAVTREQAAQIIQNAEPFIFQKMNMEKLKGTIEAINIYTDKTNNNNTAVTTVDVRNSNGTLHRFRFTKPSAEENTNEMAGLKNAPMSKGVIVNDFGNLKDENALALGQEISYIVRGGKVLYIKVNLNQKKVEYRIGRILSVDEPNRVLRSEMLLAMPFSDIRLVDSESLVNISPTGVDEVLSVSEDALIYIDFAKKSLKDVQPESLMLMTVENDLVTSMENLNLDLLQEKGIVSGILEENNPILGYVTLFFPDGSGTSRSLSMNLSNYRTYSYLRTGDVTVYKNGKTASIEELKPGDSVFLKLNENGILVQISGTDNYYPVNGRVRTKSNGTLLLEKQDGTFENLQIPLNTPVFQERRRVTWNDIKEGDNIRILLQKTANEVVIGEVVLEKNKPETSGIYRAQLAYYDTMDRSLAVSGLQQFKDGIWRAAVTGGISILKMNEQYMPEIQKGAHGTVYLATGKNLLGKETVISMAIEEHALQSEVISDTIIEAQPGRGTLTLLNRDTVVSYNSGSIIVRGGRLLEPNQVKAQDDAYIVTSSLIDGSQKANIVWLHEAVTDTGLSLLRGRISQINALSSMTLESFSQFNLPSWEFMNVPKTLNIDPAITRVYDDSGRTDLTDFDDNGENSFRNRTVYVLVQDGKAMLVSTAPYGDVVTKGRIEKLEGFVTDAVGHVITPPVSIYMGEARSYNPQTWLWENKENIQVSLPVNAVLVKNGSIINAESLEIGDRITVIQSAAGNDAYIIFAESY